LVGDETAIHLHPQLHHARGAAPVDHHIVHGQGLEHAFIAPHHAGFDQRAAVFFVAAFQHGLQRGLEVLIQRDVGDKAQAPLVDADQRRAVA